MGRSRIQRLTCREAIGMLADYLDATLAPREIRRLDAHLGECTECVAYINTYRRTREVAGAAAPAMPDEMKARLRRFLREQLAAHPR